MNLWNPCMWQRSTEITQLCEPKVVDTEETVVAVDGQVAGSGGWTAESSFAPGPVRPLVVEVDVTAEPERPWWQCTGNAFWFYTVLLIGFILWVYPVMRAEMRYNQYVGVDNKTKHEATSMWMFINCPDWDDRYSGSQQPVKCSISWLRNPGMVFSWIGELVVLAGGFSLMACCKCCQCCQSEIQPKVVIAATAFGAILQLLGWLLVLTNDMDGKLPHTQLNAPHGILTNRFGIPFDYGWGLIMALVNLSAVTIKVMGHLGLCASAPTCCQ